MSEFDEEKAINPPPPSQEDANEAPEQTSEDAPDSATHIFERLNQTLTRAASGQMMPGVIRIPRADRKPLAGPDQPVARDQSKVISLKRRSTKLTPTGESSPPVAVQPTVVRHTTAQTPAVPVSPPSSPLPTPVASTPAPVTQAPVAPVAPMSWTSPVGQPTSVQPVIEESHNVELQDAVASPAHGSDILPLIDRMEQQINKVTSNLMARVDQILAKLEEDAGNLEKSGLNKQEQDETALDKLCRTVTSTLDRVSEDARGKVLDKSTTGQRSVQSILETGHTTIDQQSKESMDSLLKRSKGLRVEHGELTQAAQKKFSLLVKQRASDVQSLIEMVKSDWEKLTAAEVQGLEERDTRANELVSKETDSISSTFVQYCQSLERDLDEAWEQSAYEVNLTRKQCLAAVDETLKIWQQRLILLTKSVIDSDIAPRLKELRDQLDNQVEDLKEQFSMRNEADRAVQMNDVEVETVELKRQFKKLASEAEDQLYGSITDQQDVISHLFINHRDDIQGLLRNAEDELESMHTKLKKCDAACRKLLISSAASLGLSLATEREKLISNLQELRRTTMQAMEDRLHQDLVKLEEAGKRERSTLSDYSANSTRTIKEKCRTAIAEIQADVELAFQEIQKSREQFLQ